MQILTLLASKKGLERGWGAPGDVPLSPSATRSPNPNTATWFIEFEAPGAKPSRHCARCPTARGGLFLRLSIKNYLLAQYQNQTITQLQ